MSQTASDDGVVEARLAEVIDRFGAQLSAEQRDQVRTRIKRTLTVSGAMRSVSFGNGDEPEIVFMPYRGES